MSDIPETAEERAATDAEILQLIADDLLPKLVEILHEIEPRFRQRTINAALALLG